MPQGKADWEQIEKEYRSGTISNVALAAQHQVSEARIRQYAKKHGWVKDLTFQVQERARAELAQDALRQAVRASNAQEIIEAAGLRSADVVRSHRKDLRSLARRRDTLMLRFDTLAGLEGELLGSWDQLGMATDILEAATRVTTKLIPLERQAFNMDEKTPPQAPGDTSDAKSRLTERLSKLAQRSNLGGDGRPDGSGGGSPTL